MWSADEAFFVYGHKWGGGNSALSRPSLDLPLLAGDGFPQPVWAVYSDRGAGDATNTDAGGLPQPPGDIHFRGSGGGVGQPSKTSTCLKGGRQTLVPKKHILDSWCEIVCAPSCIAPFVTLVVCLLVCPDAGPDKQEGNMSIIS